MYWPIDWVYFHQCSNGLIELTYFSCVCARARALSAPVIHPR